MICFLNYFLFGKKTQKKTEGRWDDEREKQSLKRGKKEKEKREKRKERKEEKEEREEGEEEENMKYEIERGGEEEEIEK